jgi:glycosyltransferase involved in cell wall biosynthesis
VSHHSPSQVEGQQRPVRVLIVAPSLDILGGQAIQASRLRARFARESSLHVDFLAVNPRLPGALRILQRIKFVRTLVTWPYYIATLFARAWRYDVLHVFSASYFSFVLAPTPALLIGRLFGRKMVLNYRSGEAEDHLRRWGGTAIPAIRLAHKIVVPSGYLVDVFARFGLRAESILNTVDMELFAFRRRSPLRPLFLSNRNLEPLYNVRCVLEAFSLIQRAHPDASLAIVGDGSQRAELEQLAATLQLRNVEFHGRIAPDEMPGMLNAADILLNSPNIDNMPASLIEAFAAGIPVVTTDAGGIPYILMHNVTGKMVSCADPEAMAQAALDLLQDEAATAEIIARAHAECARYSWNVVREEWLALYHQLASPASMSSPAPSLNYDRDSQLP